MVQPEDRFRQWRDAGDAGALAEVYDLAAPTLLRLALHHVRHPASAEDLVQATFLAAIQNAGSYDPRRPLLAWLVGILHNQAKWLQRREGRAVDPTRLADRAEHDPLAAASSAEFSAQCDEAIEGLPDVYRPVLRLHLKHQLTAAEIAHVLGRPPGTVRSQVTRGLELLRAALPAGIALAAFAVLTPGRGLATVRDVVLAAGQAKVASSLVAAGTGAAIGGVTMKKSMLGVVVLLAFAAGSWWAVAGNVDPMLVEPQAPAVETATTAPAAEANAIAPPAPAPGLSRDAAAASTPSWRLVGRVFEEDGAPVADASVRVQLLIDHEREPLADAHTGADGRYSVDLGALRVLPPIDLRRAKLSVSLHAPGRHAGGQVTLPHHDPTQSLLAIGDAQLVGAAVVSGRVVDADGIPVAGASVQLGPRASGASAPNAGATSDANGRYVVAAPLASGDVLVAATHMGVGRAQIECTLAEGSETTLPDLRLQASSTLRARVVFADGEPAAHVGIGIYQPGDGSRTVAMARTGDDGHLVVRTLPPGRYVVRLSSFGGEGSHPSTTVATDEDPPTIVLGRVHVLRFSFRDEAGRPLRHMDVAMGIWPAGDQAAAAFAAGAPLDPELQDRFLSAAGSFRSVVVARGTWVRVEAYHDDARAEVMVQAMPPRNVIETVLTLRDRSRDATLLLQLETPDGSDLGDVKVRLRQLYLGEPGSYERAPEHDAEARFVRWFPGRYRLEVAPKEAGMDLGWFAPFEQPVQLRRGETTTVHATVPDGGRVRFHLHTPDSRARGNVVDFAAETQAATGPAGRQRRVFIETTADGWRSGGDPPAGVPLLWAPVLPPGNHVLAIRSRDYADTSVAAVVSARAVTDVHVWLQPR
ncbi:MAG TPA: sigma-70 family RNA polymerase sigma factor [Planctomycetota bacterium]